MALPCSQTLNVHPVGRVCLFRVTGAKSIQLVFVTDAVLMLSNFSLALGNYEI